MTFRDKLTLYHAKRAEFLATYVSPENHYQANIALSQIADVAQEIQRDILNPSVTLD
jgi:hypothetical protein